MATKVETKLVSVRCIEPIRFNGKKYAPGSTLAGLTDKQADQLVAGNHAELLAEDAAVAEGEGGKPDASAPVAEASAKK